MRPGAASLAAGCLLLAILSGCQTITGRLWSDFPEYRIETTTQQVDDAVLHLAREAPGQGGNGPDEPTLLAFRAALGGLPESWTRLLAPVAGLRGRQGWLVLRGSARARVVTALLAGTLGLEPSSCAAVFRQGTGANDERLPLRVPLVIQGDLPSVGFVVLPDDVAGSLPELPAPGPSEREPSVGTSAAEHFALLPWLELLGAHPDEEVRYRLLAFTDGRGRPVADPMAVDRLVRWGGTTEEMASLRDVFAVGEARAGAELRCYVLVPAPVLLLAIVGEISASGRQWVVETAWLASAHPHVPEDVELASAPIAVPGFAAVFQTRAQVQRTQVGWTVGRVLLTPLTVTLDVVTLGLGLALWGVFEGIRGD